MTAAPDRRPDLFSGHVAETIPLRPDRWGRPAATLVERTGGGERAALYVHGYNDYHHLEELGPRLAAMGLRFFAIDLRDHGRSIRPGRPNSFATDLSAYYEELREATCRIRRRGVRHLTLIGHSTGGLTTSLFAADVGGVDALLLNSPFFGFRATAQVGWTLRHVWPAIGRVSPMRPLPVEPDPRYAWSLHRSFGRGGAWDYDLGWKRPQGLPVRAGWVGAIARGHARVRSGPGLGIPVLSLVSAARGGDDEGFDDRWFESDTVLDPADCLAGSRALGPNVEVARIAGGMHDLVLSRPAVRAEVYDRVEAWLATL